jgi:hypothetical protein
MQSTRRPNGGCKTVGSHSGVAEVQNLLGCLPVSVGSQPLDFSKSPSDFIFGVSGPKREN